MHLTVSGCWEIDIKAAMQNSEEWLSNFSSTGLSIHLCLFTFFLFSVTSFKLCCKFPGNLCFYNKQFYIDSRDNETARRVLSGQRSSFHMWVSTSRGKCQDQILSNITHGGSDRSHKISNCSTAHSSVICN